VHFGSINGTNFAFVLDSNIGIKVFAIDASQRVGPPVITQIAPATGPLEGGTWVTITGSGFLPGAKVQFGASLAATASFSDATELTAMSPAHAAGAVDLRVVNLDGQSATFANGFVYGTIAPPPPPTIASVARKDDNLEMVWSGGTNQACLLLSSTSVSAPISTWEIIATNFVGSNGLSTNLIPMNPSELKRFYLLSIP
jgi:hypothetical protein